MNLCQGQKGEMADKRRVGGSNLMRKVIRNLFQSRNLL